MAEGIGTEKYQAQLDEMVARIQSLEQQNRDLQSRLDIALANIDKAHQEAIPEKKISYGGGVAV